MRSEGPSRRFGTRRALLLGGGACLLGGSVWLATAHEPPASPVLTPIEAFERAQRGAVLLIDIRRPDEWASTGVPEGGHPLDMRRKDFVAELTRLTGNDPTRPVALICAAGVRSRRQAAQLSQAGFINVYNVSEGMLGSRNGPGWLRRDLPVAAPPE